MIQTKLYAAAKVMGKAFNAFRLEGMRENNKRGET
jgi:hypothetical protein